jgi:hypothetical protein
VGRDLHEAERVRRLLPAQVAVAHAPSVALAALQDTDVVLLEDRSWPAGEEDAVDRLRSLSAARTLAVVLSRLRGEDGERMDVPVVERPYRIDEVVSAVRLAMLRRKG